MATPTTLGSKRNSHHGRLPNGFTALTDLQQLDWARLKDQKKTQKLGLRKTQKSEKYGFGDPNMDHRENPKVVEDFSKINLAEREGFEPPVGISYARFPGVCLKPLSHLSASKA